MRYDVGNMKQWQPHDKSEYSCLGLVPIEGRQYNWMDLRILGSWNNDQLRDHKFKDYK